RVARFREFPCRRRRGYRAVVRPQPDVGRDDLGRLRRAGREDFANGFQIAEAELALRLDVAALAPLVPRLDEEHFQPRVLFLRVEETLAVFEVLLEKRGRAPRSRQRAGATPRPRVPAAANRRDELEGVRAGNLAPHFSIARDA